MAKQFNVLEMAEEEALTVTLKDGKVLRSKDLLPEVVDQLGQIIDKRAQEDAKDEAEQRRLARILTRDDDPGDEELAKRDEEFAKASLELTQLTTRASQRGRELVYEQLAVVFTGENDSKLTTKFLQQQVPLPVARQVAAELTRQILGGPEGNAAGSDGDPTPTGSTPSGRS